METAPYWEGSCLHKRRNSIAEKPVSNTLDILGALVLDALVNLESCQLNLERSVVSRILRLPAPASC